MAGAPERRPTKARVAALLAGAAALLALITWIDWATGYEFELFVFYYLPVAIAAWCASRRWGVAFGVAAAISWSISDRLAGHVYSRAWYAYWESFIRLLAFLTIAFTVAKIRESLAHERALNRELAESLERVRVLEGLIPVCAWCRRVRDDEGYWDRLEAYVSTRTGVTFTHGICPACEAKLDAANASPSSRRG
jgi:hypothetical protein